jgi:hypothetical protein
MKYFLVLVLLLLPCLSEAEDSVVEVKAPQRIGRPGWNLRVTGQRDNPALPFKSQLVQIFQTGSFRSGLEKAAPAPALIDRLISREEADIMIAMLRKYGEWAQVAHKNGVKSFTKEMGKVSPIGPTYLFCVANGKCWIQDENLGDPPFVLTDVDIADLLGLLSKLPAIDDAFLHSKPKSATDALFK